jgi:hypothetical protein
VGDADRTTLAIAVAGIAATALVGLGGTAAAWQSARADRREQSVIARQALNYERRVAVYLDAIDFVQAQERALYEYGLQAQNAYRGLPADLPRHFPPPQFYAGEFIPFQEVPPRRLTTRLRALGSSTAIDAFQRVETLVTQIPTTLTVDTRGRSVLRTNPLADRRLGRKLRRFDRAYRTFYDQINELENAVHAELGAG